MSPSTAFFLGLFAGFMIVGVTAWWAVSWFRDDAQRACTLLAGMLRGFSAQSGYSSALVDVSGEPTVVSLCEIALSIETRQLLGYAPVSVTRSDRPPPLPSRRRREDPDDGNA